MTLTNRMRIPPPARTRTRPHCGCRVSWHPSDGHRRASISSFPNRSAAGSRPHEDVVALDPHLECPKSRRRIDRVGARADVVLPSVHRARHDGAVELPFADRTASVQADVRERIEPSVDVEERDGMALDDDDAPATGRHLCRLRDADERDHHVREPCRPHEGCEKFYDGRAAWKGGYP